MSHFTVLVKVSGARLARHKGKLDDALQEMLAPFDEATEDDRYRVFKDVTDEERKNYDEKLIEQVKLDDGTFVWPWDDQFRVKGTFGMGSHTHDPPQDKLVERSAQDIYGSFDEYMNQYCGYNKSPTGRYGYHSNPNAKWDWYSIGGRWSGHFPLKAGREATVGTPGAFKNQPRAGYGDVVKISDLDFDAVAQQTQELAEKFYAEYQELLAGKQFDAFEGPRERALQLGLIEVVQGPADDDVDHKALPWSRWKPALDDDRRTWTDACLMIDHDSFMETYIDCFNPLLTYAALDDEGWTAPGKMGWFGFSSESPQEYLDWKKNFVHRIFKTALPDDTLVCVDCHI